MLIDDWDIRNICRHSSLHILLCQLSAQSAKTQCLMIRKKYLNSIFGNDPIWKSTCTPISTLSGNLNRYTCVTTLILGGRAPWVNAVIILPPSCLQTTQYSSLKYSVDSLLFREAPQRMISSPNRAAVNWEPPLKLIPWTISWCCRWWRWLKRSSLPQHNLVREHFYQIASLLCSSKWHLTEEAHRRFKDSRRSEAPSASRSPSAIINIHDLHQHHNCISDALMQCITSTYPLTSWARLARIRIWTERCPICNASDNDRRSNVSKEEWKIFFAKCVYLPHHPHH